MRKLLFAVALIAFVAACKHKPTPEEIATQKKAARQKMIDSALAVYLVEAYGAIDKGILIMRDSTRSVSTRDEVFGKLKHSFPEYLTQLQFDYDVKYAWAHNGKAKDVKTNIYTPFANNVIAMQKDFLKQRYIAALKQQFEHDDMVEDERKKLEESH